MFEILKTLLFPGIRMWQSHTLTIVFSTVVGTLAARSVLREKFRLEYSAVEAARRHEQLEAVRSRLTQRTQQLETMARAARDSEASFRAVAEAATDAIVSANVHNQISFWNAAAEQIFGFSAEEAVGSPLTIVIPEQFRAAHNAGFARVAGGEQARLVGSSVRVTGMRKSGEHFPMELSLSRWETGSGTFFTAIIRDISERVRTEVALRDSEERYRLLVERSPEAIALHTAGRLVFINSTGADFLGAASADELLGLPMSDFVHPDFQQQLRDNLTVLARGEMRDTPTEYRILRRDGTEAEAEILSVPVVYQGQRAVQTVVRDVTARQRAERALRDQHFLLSAVMEGTTDALWVKNPDGVYQMINGPGARMLGQTVESVLGRTERDLFVSESADAVRERDLDVLTTGETRTEETVSTSLDGVTRYYTTTRAPLRNSSGTVIGVIGVSRDITERKRAENVARADADRLRLVMQQLPGVLWATDRELTCTSVSGAGLAALRLIPDQVIGKSVADQLGRRESGTPLVGASRHALAGHSSSFELTVAERVFQTHMEPLRDGSGDVTGTLGLAMDVTERKRLEEQLIHQAFHDPLTGLANRALFRDRVSHAIARAARDGAVRERIAVIFLDLDDFKKVNDSLGHAEGDRLLTLIASRLRNATRESDTVARLGGDEFAILLEGVGDDSETLAVVGRVTDCTSAPAVLSSTEVTPRASVGLAYVAPGDTADDLLRNADVAMYRAKEIGLGGHAIFEPQMHAAAVDRLSLEADLRHAIDREELMLLYQPVVNLESGRVEGFEALARWSHPTRGIISPTVFIPLAEESGLILAIGKWVLATAVRQLRVWHDLGAREISVGVNISGRQLDDPSLANMVASVVTETEIAPGRLTLEVTESVAMRRTDVTLRQLHALKALGVRLAIDDFGTGYSSLNYLQRFPIDVLKIDKGFVDAMGAGENGTALANTIVTLGKTLRLRTVAEGIENHAQWAALRALGCDLGQGYLFARPLDAASIERQILASVPWATQEPHTGSRH